MAVNSLTALFFLLMLFMPQSYGHARGLLLLTLLGGILLWTSCSRMWVYSKAPLVFGCALVWLAVMGIVVGLSRGNNAAALIDAARLYVVYHVIYLLLVIYLSNTEFYPAMKRVMGLACIAISALVIVRVVEVRTGFSFLPASMVEEMLLQVGIHEGYMQINAVNVGSLLLLLPFWISYILFRPGLLKNWKIITIIGLGAVAVFLSGRRILWIVSAGTPVLALVMYLGTGMWIPFRILRQMAWAVPVCTFMLLIVPWLAIRYGLVNPLGLWERLQDAFNVEQSGVRSEQMIALLKGFWEHPIVGSGFGGTVNIVRSDASPWVFELTYVQMLYNLGIVGTVLLSALVMWVFLVALRSCRANLPFRAENLALLTAYVAFLFATASNPYLGSFDFLYITWIPLIIITLNRKSAVANQQVEGEPAPIAL